MSTILKLFHDTHPIRREKLLDAQRLIERASKILLDQSHPANTNPVILGAVMSDLQHAKEILNHEAESRIHEIQMEGGETNPFSTFLRAMKGVSPDEPGGH